MCHCVITLSFPYVESWCATCCADILHTRLLLEAHTVRCVFSSCICLARYMLFPVRLSIRLSVRWVDQSKTVGRS